jgi:hypothetical protein
MTKWAYFTESIIRNFGPDCNTTSDLASPRHIGSVNDHQQLHHLPLRIGITIEQHQVSLFVTSLQDALRVVVVRHHLHMMETAIDLAHTMETPAPASTNTGRPTFAIDNSSDITLRRDTSNSNTGSAEELPPSPHATAPTPPDSPVRPQPAGTIAVARIEPDQEILAHLRVTATEERELQIISATIEVQAAAPAWSPQQGIVRYIYPVATRYYRTCSSHLAVHLRISSLSAFT